MKYLKIFFGSVLLILITACSTSGSDSAQTSDPDAFLKKSFDEKDMVLVNQVIDYYDNFVLSKTGQKKSIKDAYQEFVTENAPLSEKQGSLSNFIPSRENRLAFFETLDKDVLSKFFHIRDTLFWHSKEGFVEAEYYPYQFSSTNTKYLNFIKSLSTRNEFYSSYNEEIELFYGFSPAVFATIIKTYSNEHEKKFSEAFNFSKKEDRFVFIATFLFTDNLSDEHNSMFRKRMTLRYGREG